MVEPTPAWAGDVPHFRMLAASELQSRWAGVRSGYEVDAPLADMSRYLPYLRAHAHDLGVSFRDAHVDRLEDIPPEFDAVVNCAGLGARDLTHDDTLVPVRGQYFVMEYPADRRVTDYVGDDEHPGGMAYLIPRHDGICLGGTEEYGEEDPRFVADPEAMLRRVADTVPWVLDETPRRIHRTVAGLRPFRPGGVRLAGDRLRDGRPVVHNYGHGGSGFSLAWGCAGDVVDLLEPAE